MAQTLTERSEGTQSGKKWVYLFDEGNASMRDLLGGKGAGVAEMTRAGLPVPPGFTITTEACNSYLAAGEQFPAGIVGSGAGGAEDDRGEDRPRVWRPAQSPAGLGPIRRQVLHAGHDGHGPEPRPQ